MKHKPYLIVLLLLALLLAPAVAPARAQEDGTVRAVMFWMEGCGHCDYVKQTVLPPLAEQYGDRWQLTLIKLHSADDFDHLYSMGAALGLPRNNIGVPFLLIGDAVLIGSVQIPSELPGLVARHVAAGGVGWPQVAGLEWFLPEIATGATASGETAPALTAAAPVNDGFALAVVVLIGMILAVGHTAARLWQARPVRRSRRSAAAPPPAWLNTALPVLALIGLIVAAYLAYVETQAVTAVCGPIGDCNAVQTSDYAYLLGVPIGVWGVLGYLAILAAWAWGKWRSDSRAAIALLAMTAFGVLFSIYLTYLEPFVIQAVCAWCLTSAVVMTLLLLISVEVARPHLRPAPIRRR
jgi:uncharacterized membrane protein